MIPFNRLGLLFKLFSSWIYPRRIKDDLAGLLKGIGPGGLVLDIGAGTGIFTAFAHSLRADLRYVVLDPAGGMIRYAPEYAHKVRGKGESLPFGKNVFSAVLMGDAIHHMADPRKAVREIKDCMTSRGTLLIFDLNRESTEGRMICMMEKLFREPAHFYSPERLSEMLTACGFRTEINRYDWRFSVKAQPED